jgi:hypothetical protein
MIGTYVCFDIISYNPEKAVIEKKKVYIYVHEKRRIYKTMHTSSRYYACSNDVMTMMRREEEGKRVLCFFPFSNTLSR